MKKNRRKNTNMVDNPKYCCTFAENIFEMRREIGKWFMDIAKYVATAVLISSFLGNFEQQWIMYLVGTITVLLSFFIGLYYIKDKK
jgi:hypothetical protein